MFETRISIEIFTTLTFGVQMLGRSFSVLRREMNNVARPGARKRPGPPSPARKSRGSAVALAALASLALALPAATAWGSPSRPGAPASQAQAPPYKNPKLPVAQRVADL